MARPSLIYMTGVTRCHCKVVCSRANIANPFLAALMAALVSALGLQCSVWCKSGPSSGAGFLPAQRSDRASLSYLRIAEITVGLSSLVVAGIADTLTLRSNCLCLCQEGGLSTAFVRTLALCRPRGTTDTRAGTERVKFNYMGQDPFSSLACVLSLPSMIYKVQHDGITLICKSSRIQYTDS